MAEAPANGVHLSHPGPHVHGGVPRLPRLVGQFSHKSLIVLCDTTIIKMDPFGAAASALTVASAAYKLGQLIRSTKNAPDEIIALSNQVADLKLVIEEVECLDRDSNLQRRSSEALSKLLIGVRIKFDHLDGFVEELLDVQKYNSLQIQRIKWATSYKKRSKRLQAELRDMQQNLGTVLAARSTYGIVSASGHKL